MNKFLKIWPFIIIILFCLTPLLWFYQKGDILINGVDTNFPLNPGVWFARRFYIWNSVANTGSDFSSSTAGLFFHLVQFIPYKLGLGLQQVQIISLVFWFSMIVVHSYFFARVIMPKNLSAQLVLVSLYSFNIYLFNTWENVKVANLSLVSAIPLALGSFILLKKGKISYFKASLLFVLSGIILSGAGINPAYFTSFYFIIFIFFISDSLIKSKYETFLTKAKSFSLLLILVTVVNLFWLLPTGNFIFNSITPSNSIGSLGFINWVDSLSFNTSILNVIRVQGAWDWYAINEKNGEPYYIPYSTVYFTRLPFILFSFLIPILALIALSIRDKKNNQYVIAFALMLIIGVFLAVGTHSPTGNIFRFLMGHLPFFSLFRSPWYIFTPMIILSLSVLTGLFFFFLSNKVKDKKTSFIKVLAVVIALGNLVYSYPLVSGKIFRPERQDSFYIKFPEYIFEAKKWLDGQNLGSRIIGYPDDKIEVFTWGYRGVDSILHLLTDKEILFSPLNTQESPVANLIDDFYFRLKRGELESSRELAAKLNVSMLLDKSDQESLLLDLPEKIKSLPKVSIGKWDFYQIYPDSNLSKIYISDQIYFGYPTGIKNPSFLEIIGQKEVLLDPQDQVVLSVGQIMKNSGYIIKSENSQVRDFMDFQNSNYKIAKSLSSKDLSKARFYFNVLEEGQYQPVLERYKVESFGLDLAKGFSVQIDGNKELLNINSVSDSYVFFEPVFFKRGEHWIELDTPSDSLVKDFWNDGKINTNTVNGGEIKLIEEEGDKTAVIKNQSGQDISFNFDIASFDPMSDYFIQVKYKHIYGYAPKVILNQVLGKEIVKRHIEQLPLSPEWDIFNFYYHPHDSNSNLKVSLLASFSKENPLGTKLAYKDLIVKRIFSNELMLLKKAALIQPAPPVVSFQRISPVEYSGEVKGESGKRLLVFMENYSPNWKLTLYDEQGSPIPGNLPHFSANLYANAWYIPEFSRNLKFKIIYSPQTLFHQGVAASVLGTVIILSVLLIIRRKYAK